MTRPSQEALALAGLVVTVGLALAALMVTTTGDIRAEARADRAAFQEEMRQLRDKANADRAAAEARAQADRAAFQEEMRQLRDKANVDRAAAEARAQVDRAAFQEEMRKLRSEARADRETFETHVTRLTRDHAALGGIVEQMRTARNDR